MTGGHGHVIPRPDGARARCGGPAICAVCAKELAQVKTDRAATVDAIAKRYGAALAEECDLTEHKERFVGLFKDAITEFLEAGKDA